MAAPLKDSFGPEVAERIGVAMHDAWAGFDRERYIELALDGFAERELTPRARHIATALAATLPADRAEAIEILIASLGPELIDAELEGMAGFFYLPHVYFVAEHGVAHFDLGMRAQYEITKRFTAEFSMRAFLTQEQDRTLAVLTRWATDPNVHVRRLVSEGSRPRLPWAPRLKAFEADPTPVLALLETLKADPEEYVRRSVANNLNDIAKDHPKRVVEVARRWWDDADDDQRRMIRHGLRTLVKAGDPGALSVLGFDASSPLEVGEVAVTPARVDIGDKVKVSVEITNPTTRVGVGLVDLVVHFAKADGSTGPKVFKGAEVTVAAGENHTITKTISVAQHSTRTHYPGTHRVDVQLNGVVSEGAAFDLVSPPES